LNHSRWHSIDYTDRIEADRLTKDLSTDGNFISCLAWMPEAEANLGQGNDFFKRMAETAAAEAYPNFERYSGEPLK
jgi:hypothetical protein